MRPPRRQRRFRSSLHMAAAVILLAAAGCNEDKTAADYIAEAKASRAAGDISTAIADLKSALQKDPKNLSARLLLAQFYLDLPDPIGAEALLWRAREDGAPDTTVIKPLAQAELLMGNPQLAAKTAELPDNAPPDLRASVLAVKAEAYIGLGRAAEARDTLATGLQLDPHSVDILAAMARYDLAVGDTTEAQARLAAAQKEDANNIALVDLQGAVAFAARDYALSINAYEHLLKAEPWNLNARLGLARAQIAAGKSEAANANLAAVLKASPADPRANYLSALVAYRNNDYATAQSQVQRALSGAKNFPPALLLAGASAYGLHQYEQANAFLSQFLYQVPQYTEARKLLAAVQIALGRAPDAVKTLTQAIEAEPNDPQLLTLIGAASAQSGDFAAADHYLDKALALQPANAALRTELGIARVALGQTESGIKTLEDASREDPNTIRPDIALFVTYFKQADYDKALEAALRLQKAFPNDATGFDFAGAAHLSQHDDAQARSNFMRARELLPGDPIACRSLASLALASGDVPAATQFYGEIVAANPHDAAAASSLAELQDQQGLRGEAIATLKTSIEQNPDDPAPRLRLGKIELVAHDNEAALTAIQPLLSRDPKDIGALEIAGQAQLGLGNFDAARDAFNAMVGLQPDSSRGHRDLAAAYLAAGQADAAAAEANKAVEADPKDVTAKMMLARVYVAAGGAANARTVLDEVARQYPNDSFVAELESGVGLQQDQARAADERIEDALAQAKAGQIDAAEAALKDWLAAHPDDVTPREALADIELAANRLDAAQSQYEGVLARDPRNTAAENNLAWIFSRKGDAQAALDHAQRAIKLTPDAARVLDTLGVAYLQNQRIDDAMASLTKAAQAAPADPAIQFHFAQALVGVGEEQHARDVLRNLLALKQAFDERDRAETLLKSLGG